MGIKRNILSIITILLNFAWCGRAKPIDYPSYSCPSFEEERVEVDLYKKYNAKIDIPNFIETFRQQQADSWGRSFVELKQGLYEWKQSRFIDLKDGDTIYESACGVGMNLLLTLEIVKEVKNVSNIVVYGNDYVARSAEIANALMDGGLLPDGASKGVICQGDSSNISFVPSNSFDLVFTGFLQALQNPLGYDLDIDDLWYSYKRLCKQENTHQIKIVELMQKRQEDWFDLWVSEQIRIAKPGAPVIIEQLTKPVCEEMDDWGGVRKDFWKDGVARYGWDIDPDSIEFAVDTVMEVGRYNVFMRKNKEHNTTTCV
mmetsp:Transcript_12838/g.16824  ORF Transcript_12838/g.16824 Transcript_12838/m.16824 type:complete len:315 (-) Transcript_12838:626-1570(-)